MRTLRIFNAVASTENLTQAAQANHLAVGAASRRISNFEAMIGEPLLERNSRGLRLTPAGHLVAAGLGLTVAPEGLARPLKTAFKLKLIELDGEHFAFNEIILHNCESIMTDTERGLPEHLRKDREPGSPPRHSKNKCA